MRQRKVPWPSGRAFIVGFILITGAIILCKDINSKSADKRCTEETNAYLVDEHVEEYLYAPYHGGRVTTQYNTTVYYVVDIMGARYNITLSMPGKRVAPVTLPVKYNPNNLGEFMYNTTELNYLIGNDEEWLYYDGEGG